MLNDLQYFYSSNQNFKEYDGDISRNLVVLFLPLVIKTRKDMMGIVIEFSSVFQLLWVSDNVNDFCFGICEFDVRPWRFLLSTKHSENCAKLALMSI